MLSLDRVGAGYGKKIVLSGVSLEIKEGEIVCLIGPNGSGKSTVLKTIVRELKAVEGSLTLLDRNFSRMKGSEIAREISMVMTERIHPQLMTCREVISTGRYPYTGRLGILSEEDRSKVEEAISMVGAENIADCDFNEISDGQKQRIMVARAICQDTKIIVLDEPTSYLDMFHKIDLLKIIRRLAREKNKTIIMSLHELDLVKMVSDRVVCIGENKVLRVGAVDDIFCGNFIQNLYGVRDDEFDPTDATLHVDFDEEKKTKRTIAENNVHAKVIMVQGTMSNAGKSLIVAGLCRIFAQDGYKVAPFKSQNMALNSYVTEDGLEMGRAQAMQAEAAGIECDVSMNPILLKPTSDMGSQVIVNGEVIGNMKAKEYFEYKKNLVPEILKAFSNLEKKADIIVIEGAGSPAEINLKGNDIVNMGLAEMLDAPVLLVGDIDCGGVFAQLAGTVGLLEKKERDRICGLVINKFRGDKTILDPGISMIEARLGIPVAGVVPYMDIKIDDEDSQSSVFLKKEFSAVNIGVIHLPRISNFTDFTVFEKMDEVSVHYIERAEDVFKMDMIIIPGSKNTIADLIWMRQRGIESTIKKVSEDKIVFGICGGYQMLGKEITDPNGIESEKQCRGMELIDATTEITESKTRVRVNGKFENVSGMLCCLNGCTYSGYEIHMGKTEISGTVDYVPSGAGCGNVYGTYLHGIFDEGEIAWKIADAIARTKGIELEKSNENFRAFKERQYDILADNLRKTLDMDAVYGMLRPAFSSDR
ncbi:cobyric acid synthase [Treponema sp.]|uniref:cobyric acid synthase n=1 Tax=Treponema sp. TaxID=166 RepID=UPI00298DFA24|nr:cobyric acid synthase [Treponema sp.]